MTDGVVLCVVVVLAMATLTILFALYRYLAAQGVQHAFLGMILLLTLGTEYCLRPLMILASGQFGWEPSVLRPLTDSDAGGLAIASILSMVGIGALALSLTMTCRPGGWRGIPSTDTLLNGSSAGSTMSVPLSVVTVMAIIASAAVALQLGSIGGSLQGDFGRQRFTSGYSYLLVNLAGLSLVVALASLPPTTLLRWRTRSLLVGSYIAFAGTHFLVLGGRAEIIIVTISALMITTARLGRPRKGTLVAVLSLATILLGLQRVSTREAFAPENRDASPLSLAVESLRDPLALVTKYDVSAYDKLVMLEDAGGELGYGETYLAALATPVPGKASRLEGGNRVFTKRFLPSRYERGVTYEGMSMFGEARYNFGWIGPPLVGVLAGWAYGALVRRAKRGDKWLLTLSLAAGLFPGLIRADALNTAALGGSLIAFTLLISGVVTRRQSRRSGPLPAASIAGERGPSPGFGDHQGRREARVLLSG